MNTHVTSQPEIKCQFCPILFLDQSSQWIHENRFHCAKHYPCAQCSEVFQGPKKLLDHKNSVHCKTETLCSDPGAKPKKMRKYSMQHLKKALDEVRSGIISPYRAAKIYDIPLATIQARIKENYPDNFEEQCTVMNKKIEEQLVNWIVQCHEMGDSQYSFKIRTVAGHLVNFATGGRKTFINEKPSLNWICDFKKRNPNILYAITKPPKIISNVSYIFNHRIEQIVS